MSSNLTVEPVDRKKKILPDELKLVLQRKFGGVIHNKIMDESDISYLRGLVDSDINGASKLLEYIEKYGEIILDEQF